MLESIWKCNFGIYINRRIPDMFSISKFQDCIGINMEDMYDSRRDIEYM